MARVSELPRKAVHPHGEAGLAARSGFAGRTALGLGKRVGGRPAELVAAEVQARTAEQLFKVLGELKGGAMKFGQAMSIFEAALPEELAGPYRATLTKLQDAAPADAGRDRAHRCWPTSSAPAGGAVRLLRRHAGRRRVDRPGAPGGMGGRPGRRRQGPVPRRRRRRCCRDLDQVSRVARVSAGWIPGLDIKPIMDELQRPGGRGARLRASRPGPARRSPKAFAGDPDFAIPHVVHQRGTSSSREWLEARRCRRSSPTARRPERDAAGQRYLEFLLAGPQRAGLLHADPHPGNFRLHGGRAARRLDFGAVNRLPDGLPPAMAGCSRSP